MLLRRMIEHVKAQNWVAIAIDFVIVVLGVGVALLAEQWISSSQQRADYKVAERNLKADVFNNYLFAKERISLSECRRQRLLDIAAALEGGEEAWVPLEEAGARPRINFAFSPVYSSPARPWGSRLWESELNRGTLSALGVDERADLGLYFYGAQTIADLQNQIQDDSARLKSLAVLNELTSSDRARYMDAVMEIDNSSGIIELIAAQMVAIADDMYADFTYSDEELMNIRRSLSERNAEGQRVYGDCFREITSPLLEEVAP